MENTVAAPQKIKNSVLHDTAISFLGIHPEELKVGSPKDIYTPCS